MSRVQLALNVSDIDAAVEFYSNLFGNEPTKRQPGYANFAVADPPLMAGPDRERLGAGHGSRRRPQPSGCRSRDPRGGPGVHPSLGGGGPGPRGPGVDDLPLCRAGQSLGQRPRRCALGGLCRARRRTGVDGPGR